MTIAVPPCNLDALSNQSGKSPAEIEAFLDLIRRSMEPSHQSMIVLEKEQPRIYNVQRLGLGLLNTEFGPFWLFHFSIDDTWKKYSVLVRAELDRDALLPVFKNREQLVLRTDSGCETGQVFHDQTCECGEQLRLAMKIINEVGEGMIVCIPQQDGRGMGHTFKLATLWIQHELKASTTDAAALLAKDLIIDVRTYAGVICVLKFFGIDTSCQINLATNNPDKVGVFGENGYTVAAELVPVVVPATEHTAQHLEAKHRHLGHVGIGGGS